MHEMNSHACTDPKYGGGGGGGDPHACDTGVQHNMLRLLYKEEPVLIGLLRITNLGELVVYMQYIHVRTALCTKSELRCLFP